VLDCGANVGVFARVALDAGARIVVAIEPGPANLEALRRNLAPEIASGRVIVAPKGVWDREDILTLKVDPKNTGANTFVMQLREGHSTLEAPLTTIDNLVAELGLERVDYIKMDIEGAEQRALAGAAATLAKFRPRLSLSAYHLPDDPVRIPELVRQAWPGYGMECGPCAEADGRIRPDVLYFR
jgi:FkbM family methyltransferase